MEDTTQLVFNIDIEFEDFFKKVDVKAIEKRQAFSFSAEKKERMKQSFIKHGGWPRPSEVWPELFPNKLGM
jgi:hypothetical protein